jgi:hypothetical protein
MAVIDTIVAEVQDDIDAMRLALWPAARTGLLQDFSSLGLEPDLRARTQRILDSLNDIEAKTEPVLYAVVYTGEQQAGYFTDYKTFVAPDDLILATHYTGAQISLQIRNDRAVIQSFKMIVS